jgi:hypothetical protein
MQSKQNMVGRRPPAAVDSSKSATSGDGSSNDWTKGFNYLLNMQLSSST